MPTRRPLGILNLLLFLSYLLPCPPPFLRDLLLPRLSSCPGGRAEPSPMNVLRIYKIRYDRGCVSREIIYPRRPLTLLSLDRTRGARFRVSLSEIKARPAKKKARPAEYKSTHILFDAKFIGPKKSPEISVIRLSTPARAPIDFVRLSTFTAVVPRCYARGTIALIRTQGTIVSIDSVSLER